MIPYFNIDRLPSLGPLKIHVFGILVATGILVGSKLTRDRARELGLTDEKTGSMITTILICGFLFSHWFDVFAYQMSGESPTLWQWLWPFAGISSYGGFMGAVGGLFWWCYYDIKPAEFSIKKRKVPEQVMKYADSLAFGLAAGWAFGRMGCFTAHDHPGRITNFFLGVKYPEGVRHDLGLDEALFALALSILFAILSTRARRVGFYAAIACTFYGPVRFALDFLRVEGIPGADPRYVGLTPAQYGAIAVFLTGLAIAWRITRPGRHITTLTEPQAQS